MQSPQLWECVAGESFDGNDSSHEMNAMLGQQPWYTRVSRECGCGNGSGGGRFASATGRPAVSQGCLYFTDTHFAHV